MSMRIPPPLHKKGEILNGVIAQQWAMLRTGKRRRLRRHPALVQLLALRARRHPLRERARAVHVDSAYSDLETHINRSFDTLSFRKR